MQKSRELSPRNLSPASSTASTSSTTDYYGSGLESPNSILAPMKQRADQLRKPKTLENSGFLRGIWTSKASSKAKKTADSIGGERREESEQGRSNGKIDRNPQPLLGRQRSCTEFIRIRSQLEDFKENRNPILGGSTRYTRKSNSLDKSQSSEEDNGNIMPGRFSIDEVAVRNNSFSKYDSGLNFDFSLASYMAPTVSSRKHRIDDLPSRSRRWSGEHLEIDNNKKNSPKIFNSGKKGGGDWAGPLARTGSQRALSSPKGKGMRNILNLGINLVKGRKSSSASSSAGPGSAENVHQLKLLHNGLARWRFSNAKSEVTNENYAKHCEEKFQHVQVALFKLQQSILQRKLQLQKEKLEMKLNYIIQSQMKVLEVWANMERQYSSAISNTTDCLHSVVCKIPLVDGAKVEPQMASAMCAASNFATKINIMVAAFQPTVEKNVGVVAKLATVVIQEKQLLEECLDLFKFISTLELEERSLRSSIMQLRLMLQQQQQQGMLA
ncbi:QWRF motif-containing protein 3-like [Salvia splendens]|uniref:QWRF motif-containing protein 3-like n=1 Tax=Salvia splendens TaxID=180675 RepID=UPI001C25699B|nr:QWRF motif-containing protein 3-like [Salvia splendens]